MAPPPFISFLPFSPVDSTERVDQASIGRRAEHRNLPHEKVYMMGWLLTPKTGAKQLPCAIPGVRNFYMVGQWISPGGGLPAGLITARNAINRL
jgi:hypothetical protein